MQGAVAIVLSGGAGKRLWPASTPERPKQFLRLFGPLSLFQQTLERVRAAGIASTVVVANEGHRAHIESQAAEIGFEDFELLLEPAARDSGPAIAVSVRFVLQSRGADTTVLTLPSDHLIDPAEAFRSSAADALAVAQAGYLCTIGVAPTHPSTEFGYIQSGPALPAPLPGQVATRFHEKPDARAAAAYIRQGFAWNAGIFAFQAGLFAGEAARHMPEVWGAAERSVAQGRRIGRTLALDRAAFAECPKISIDYALIEKSGRVATVRASFAWSDVGNWRAAKGALAPDPCGNAAIGDVLLRDANGNLALAEGVRLALIGVDGLCVVATPTGVLVAPLERVAEIKTLLES